MIKARQKITLPSGGTCSVRRVSGDDFINSGLTPIVADLRKSAKAALSSAEMSERDAQNMVKVTRMMLIRCVGPITFEDGTVIKIVDDKPFHQCSENEVTIEELDQDDANAIGAAIFKLSGLTKEAAAAAAPFPQEQEAAPSPSPDSEGIRPTPN